MEKQFSFLLLRLFIIGFSFSLQANDYKFRHYKVEDGLSSNTIRAIIQDHNGFMWFGTEDGLNRFDGYNFKVFRNILGDSTSLGNNYVYSILQDKDHRLWIGTEEGVYVYSFDSEKFSFFNQQTSDGTMIKSNVQQIIENGAYIWFATFGQNIFRFDKKTNLLEQFSLHDKGTNETDYICQIYKDHQHTIWASTSQKQTRISRFDPVANRFVAFMPEKLLPSNLSVHHFFEDSRGNFWLGTWTDGICKLDRQTGTLQMFLQPRNNKGISHIHCIAAA